MKIKKIIQLFILFSFICFFSYKVFAGTLSSDIDGIDDNRYPQFKNMINSLKQTYPNYNFQVYYTGINWQEAILREYQGHYSEAPMNLFKKGDNYAGMWYCPICGLRTYDNGLNCASREAIEYMMDARNSLNNDSVFQFKTLETPDVTYLDISNIVNGKGAFINNDEAKSAIYDASVEHNVNGYYLVAKIIAEHGNNGTSLTSGTYPGFEGIYNYFNIGSYGNGTDAIIRNGLEYARKSGWTSIRESIRGGAKIVKDLYIGRGQNTSYYQKFNVADVDASKLFTHQYQQNVLGAENEGRILKSYYGPTANHTFIIPLYENMPANASPRPDTSKSNSYSYEEARVNVNAGSSLKVRATPAGIEIGKLNSGESIKILERAKSLVNGLYYDLVVSNEDGTYGYAAREEGGKVYLLGNGVIKTDTVGGGSTTGPTTPPPPPPIVNNIPCLQPNTITIEGTNINLSPDVNFDKLSTYLTDSTFNIVDKNENPVTEGILCTGYKVYIDENLYTIVKKADVDGNGKITINDVVKAFNHIDTNSKIKITDPAQLKASEVKANGGNTSITDIVAIFNYVAISMGL